MDHHFADNGAASTVISTQSCCHIPVAPPALGAVIIDWDDTLASNTVMYDGMPDALLKKLYQADKPPASFSEKVTGTSFRGYLEQWFAYQRRLDENFAYEGEKDPKMAARNVFVELIDRVKKRIDTVGPDALPQLYDGSKAILQWLIDHNIPVAIVSNSDESLMKKAVPQVLGDELAAKLVVCGIKLEDSGKPHPDSTQRALGLLQEKWQQTHPASEPFPQGKHVYFVGDSSSCDLAVAHTLGMTGVLFGTRDLGHVTHNFIKGDDYVPPRERGFLYADNPDALLHLFRQATLPRQHSAIAER